MQQQMNLVLEPLNSHPGLKQFKSGKTPVDNWFKTQAGQAARAGRAVAIVAYDAAVPDVIIAIRASQVCSLPAAAFADEARVALSLDPRKPVQATGMFNAIRLCWLGVDERFKGQGFGAYMLYEALRQAVDLSKEVGLSLLVVDAIDDEAVAFYNKFGFIPYAQPTESDSHASIGMAINLNGILALLDGG